LLLRWAPAALAPAAVAYGLAATGTATAHGALTTYAGRSPAAAAVDLAAGWALIAAGLATWWRQPHRPLGALAVVAGAAWFTPDWVGWQTGPGGVRIVALAAQGITAAAVLQIALGTPTGLTASGRARLFAGAVWALTAVVGVGRLLLYDPFADPDCFTYCAANPLLVAGSRSAARALDLLEYGVAIAAAAPALPVMLRLARRRGVARRNLVPLVLPAALLLCAWAAHTTALVVAPGDDPRRHVLVATFAVRAVALVALAAGLSWAVSRARRGAGAVRRLAAVSSEPAAATLEAALARATGDASLRVAFPLTGDEGWISGDGASIAVPGGHTDGAVTLITREGRPLAAVFHHPASLDASTLEREIGAAAQLVVDNERLRAEARAQLRELAASRARIVEAGDAERRRLERDLHDGAQQRLVGLSIVLAMAADAFGAGNGSPGRAEAIGAADADLRGAIAELRELAHGLHPVELSDEGLGAALETLADRAAVEVRLAALPDERLPIPVETAGYILVDEVVRRAVQRGRGAPLTVAAHRAGSRLVVEIDDPGTPSPERALADLAAVADRVSALDGRLSADLTPPAGVRIRAELPCA
jgi:signal transduction histidine kinase